MWFLIVFVIALLPASLFRWRFGERVVVVLASAAATVLLLFGVVYATEGYVDGLMLMFIPAYFVIGLVATLLVNVVADRLQRRISN